MFDDDNAARHALQTITDDPVPPVATTVDQVLRRGRRRVFVQRAAAAAGVMAVVAAIGVGAMLLRPGGGVQVGDSDPAGPPGLTTTVSPPTSKPSLTPPTPLLPGGTSWAPVEMPADADSGSGCVQMEQPPPDSAVALLPEDTVKHAFSNAVAETITQPVSLTSSWQEHSPKQGGAPSGFIEGVVVMDGGDGGLQLEALRFGGTPVEYADWSRRSYGNCDPPWRRVLDDGSVLQLFQVDDFNAKKPMQHLQIFRPDGRMYIITSIGITESNADGSGKMRGTWPVGSAGLGDIAERLVSNLR